jgi:hypothetical protein
MLSASRNASIVNPANTVTIHNNELPRCPESVTPSAFGEAGLALEPVGLFE